MNDPRKKFDVLKKSFESGVIDEGEYETEKENLEPQLKEFDKQVEELNKPDLSEEPKKSSEKNLVISIAVIILLLVSIFAFSYFYKPQPQTLEDLHILNLKGKLKPSQGYVYKGVYSFINFEDFWYTDFRSPNGTKVYSLNFRYSPRNLSSIPIEGNLNSDFFNNKSEFYYTFNPKSKELSYIFLAVADFSTQMKTVYGKNPIAACDRNETEACRTVPIITCGNTDKLVLYIKEAKKFRAYYNNNCIAVEGNGIDLVKGVDRILYNLYGIMEQEEV